MKWVVTMIAGIFLCCSAISTQAACHGRFCNSHVIPAAYNGLSPQSIARIQQRYQGRVIGVRPSGGPCREIERNVVIDGRQTTARDYACQQPDGTWSTERNYDVQVLTRQGSVIIVTVDSNGRVLGVQK